MELSAISNVAMVLSFQQSTSQQQPDIPCTIEFSTRDQHSFTDFQIELVPINNLTVTSHLCDPTHHTLTYPNTLFGTYTWCTCIRLRLASVLFWCICKCMCVSLGKFLCI